MKKKNAKSGRNKETKKNSTIFDYTEKFIDNVVKNSGRRNFVFGLCASDTRQRLFLICKLLSLVHIGEKNEWFL